MRKVATKLIREGQILVKTASCLFTPFLVFITGAFFSSDFAYRSKNKNDKETLLNKEVLLKKRESMRLFMMPCKAFVPFKYGNGIPLLLPSLPVNMLHYRKLNATYYLSPILVIFKGLLKL